jgi:hypothetical protein
MQQSPQQMLSITTEQIQKVDTLLLFFFSKKLKCGHARYGFFFFLVMDLASCMHLFVVRVVGLVCLTCVYKSWTMVLVDQGVPSEL